MKLTKFALAGLLALSLSACHVPGGTLCDDTQSDSARALCIALIIGAVKGGALLLLSASETPA
jgi:hypothetical protein